jgi:hypothetical protein
MLFCFLHVSVKVTPSRGSARNSSVQWQQVRLCLSNFTTVQNFHCLLPTLNLRNSNLVLDLITVPLTSPAMPTASDVEWSFPQFNNLPKEIRLLIWKEALPEPRIVFLERIFLPWYPCTRVWSDKAVHECHQDGSPTFFNVYNGCMEMNELWVSGEPGIDYGPECQCCGFHSACPPPVLLFVCRESFDVACRFYSRAFGTENALATTWFDFERDILYIDWNSLGARADFHLSDLGYVDAGRVKHLALFDALTAFWNGGLGHDDQTEYEDYEQWICDVLRVFCNLKKLTIVVSQGHEAGGRDGGDLVFRKAENLLGLFKFQISTMSDTGWSFNGALKSFRVFFRNSIEPFDVERLEQYKNKLTEKGLPTWTVLPAIDFQVVTTPQLRTQLDRVETLFDQLPMSKQREILREDVILRCIINEDTPEPVLEFSNHTFLQ